VRIANVRLELRPWIGVPFARQYDHTPTFRNLIATGKDVPNFLGKML
jgi:hypothetical protein